MQLATLWRCPLVASTCTLTLVLPSRQDLSQPRRVRSPPGEGAGAHQQTQQPAGAVPQHRGRPEDPGHDQVNRPPWLRPHPPDSVLPLTWLSSASTGCSAASDTRWRTAAEQKTMETPPTAATPPSTVTRLVVLDCTASSPPGSVSSFVNKVLSKRAASMSKALWEIQAFQYASMFSDRLAVR